jgi:hypothetical protein
MRWARPRRRIRGAEDSAVDVRSGPFRRRAILRSRASGSGERDRPTGTSEHTDRARDLLRRERVLLSKHEWPSFCEERERGVKRIRHRHTRDNNMRLRCEKKGDPGCQSKETHPTSTRLQYELIGNRLYSLLPIQQWSIMDLSSPLLIGNWSVTDFTCPLPIGLTFVTCSFNIHYKEFL